MAPETADADTLHPGVSVYRGILRNKWLWAAAIAAVTVVVAIYSLSVSSFGIGFADAFGYLLDYILGNEPETYMDWVQTEIVVNDNVPRTLCGVAVGSTLAVSGAVIQSITRNPLTDPYTIGISSAAMFGVTISVVLGISVLPAAIGDLATMANAFVFSLIPALAIVFVSSFKKVSPTMMILIGIAMMYVFSAFTTFLQFNATDEDISEIYEWSLGTMSATDWSSVLPMVGSCAVLCVTMMVLANRINVLSSGESMSVALGVNPVRLRVICFVIASLATAVSVCYTGTIGFVGLVAPHIARLFVGNNMKALIPMSMMIGAITILGADCIVRLLPGGLPLGIITSIIGSPLFLYFLYRQRKQSNW